MTTKTLEIIGERLFYHGNVNNSSFSFQFPHQLFPVVIFGLRKPAIPLSLTGTRSMSILA